MDEENLIFPPDIPELNADSEPFNIEDYLFELDTSKIRDISDYDQESDWIPRLDRFGEFLGDGILEPRRKIVKAVFHGFYEDLKENSEVIPIGKNLITFISDCRPFRISESVGPIHLFSYNKDVLIDKDRIIASSKPWISSNLTLKDFNINERFILQCFEIARLTHISQETAELIKILSILTTDHFNLTENNFELIAVSLFHFVTTSKEIEIRCNWKLEDSLEIPIYFGFNHLDITSKQFKFENIYLGSEYSKYRTFKNKLVELNAGKGLAVHYKFKDDVDISYQNDIISVYSKFLTQAANQFLKELVLGEFITLNRSIFRENALSIFNKKFKGSINLLKGRKWLDFIRLVVSMECSHIYRNMIWGYFFLYTLLATNSYLLNRRLQGISFSTKAHVFTTNRRDYIQSLYSYSILLRSLKQHKFNYKILNQNYNFLFIDFQRDKFQHLLDFAEYSLIIYYIIPSRIFVNQEITSEIKHVIGYLSYHSKLRNLSVPSISNEYEFLGLELLSEFVDDFGYESLKKVIASRSIELFYLIYRAELLQESPDIEKIISVSELILILCEDRNTFSEIYPIPYDFTNERIIHYLNLFIFYLFLPNYDKYNLLETQFHEEFEDKIDAELFQSLSTAIRSEGDLINYLQSDNILKMMADPSVIHFIELRELIMMYFETNNLEDLILNLLSLIKSTIKFETFRPKLEVIKLTLRLMMRDMNRFENQIISLKDELNSLIHEFTLDLTESEISMISDNELITIIGLNNLSVFLSPIR